MKTEKQVLDEVLSRVDNTPKYPELTEAEALEAMRVYADQFKSPSPVSQQLTEQTKDRMALRMHHMAKELIAKDKEIEELKAEYDKLEEKLSSFDAVSYSRDEWKKEAENLKQQLTSKESDVERAVEALEKINYIIESKDKDRKKLEAIHSISLSSLKGNK